MRRLMLWHTTIFTSTFIPCNKYFTHYLFIRINTSLNFYLYKHSPKIYSSSFSQLQLFLISIYYLGVVLVFHQKIWCVPVSLRCMVHRILHDFIFSYIHIILLTKRSYLGHALFYSDKHLCRAEWSFSFSVSATWYN